MIYSAAGLRASASTLGWHRQEGGEEPNHTVSARARAMQRGDWQASGVPGGSQARRQPMAGGLTASAGLHGSSTAGFLHKALHLIKTGVSLAALWPGLHAPAQLPPFPSHPHAHTHSHAARPHSLSPTPSSPPSAVGVGGGSGPGFRRR